MDDAVESQGVAHYPPGSPAPKTGDRVAALREPDRLASLNAGKAEWYAKPLDERRRITAERQANRARRAAEREAKRQAKNGHSPTDPPPDTDAASDVAPPTVRSQRSGSTLASSPPDSTIPRPGVRGSPLKGLLDLCEALPSLGDGTCFIQVSRVKPPTAFGIPCAGVQRPLWESIDDAEFSVIYGGAEYVLRGYEIRENGRTKALTEPVTYKVAGPPNLESALTEEDAMRPQAHIPNGAGPGPTALRRPGSLVTPAAATAEAEMYDRNLTHVETMDERKTRQAEARRQREEADAAAARRDQTETLRILSEDRRAEAERTREIYEAQLANKGSNMSEMAELLKAMKPDGESNKELLRQHSTEIQQLTSAHRDQISQLTESHQAEMRRLSDMHTAAQQRLDDQVRADRDRADKLIRETDQRSNEMIREAERRADQRVTDAQNTARTTYDDLKARSEERLRDQAAAHAQRVDDMRDSFARDLKRKDDELVLMKTGLEGNVGIILGNKDLEIKRLERELRESKATAESNKDWLGQMKKVEEQAEALGFSRTEPGEGGEPESIQTTLLKSVPGVIQSLPGIIDSATAAFRGARNPQLPADSSPGQMRGQAARGHTRALPRGAPPPVLLAPLPFATEDGGYTEPTDYQQPAPRRQPTVAPLEQSPTHAIVQPIPESQLQLQLPLPQLEHQQNPTTPHEQAQNAAAPPQQQMAPAPQQSVAPPAPAPSIAPPSMVPPAQGNGEELDPMTLGIIQGLAPDFAGAFVQRVQPQAVVERLIADNGIENVRAALAIVTVDQVIGAMGSDPNPQHAVLKTRNGQKFLRAIWVAAEKLVSG